MPLLLILKKKIPKKHEVKTLHGLSESYLVYYNFLASRLVYAHGYSEGVSLLYISGFGDLSCAEVFNFSFFYVYHAIRRIS